MSEHIKSLITNNKQTMTISRIKRLCAEGKMYLHHEASKKGYVSVKNGRSVAEYKGRFGNGFVVSLPNNEGFHSRLFGMTKSNNFYNIVYFIYK